MVIYALIAMVCFGVRVVISKRPCNIIGTALYIEINFLVEFFMGLIMLGLWIFEAISLTFTLRRTVMLTLASSFQIIAEFFLFLGIEIGIVGCVVAVVSSNFVYVCIVSSVLGKALLNTTQIAGATLSLIGVVTVTVGDMLLQRCAIKDYANLS